MRKRAAAGREGLEEKVEELLKNQEAEAKCAKRKRFSEVEPSSRTNPSRAAIEGYLEAEAPGPATTDPVDLDRLFG